jgi:hypothetical protein
MVYLSRVIKKNIPSSEGINYKAFNCLFFVLVNKERTPLVFHGIDFVNFL